MFMYNKAVVGADTGFGKGGYRNKAMLFLVFSAAQVRGSGLHNFNCQIFIAERF